MDKKTILVIGAHKENKKFYIKPIFSNLRFRSLKNYGEILEFWIMGNGQDDPEHLSH